MKAYHAPWSRLLLVTTALSTVLLIGVAATVFLTANLSFLGWLILAVPCGAALFAIRGYTISSGDVFVHRLLWNTRVSLHGLESVRFEPGAMRGSIRLFGNGGLFSFTGLYRNKTLGSYRAFVTDLQRCVVLRFQGCTVVLSPSEPEDFVREVGAVQNASLQVTKEVG